MDGRAPRDIKFKFDGINKTIVVTYYRDNAEKAIWRQVDPWGLVYFQKTGERFPEVRKIAYNIILNDEIKERYYIEALRRRISFLSINNNFGIKMNVNDKTLRLYDRRELFDRINIPTFKNEIVRENSFGTIRSTKDKPGRLEKDLQTFLFGKYLRRTTRSNERLSIFGQDFYEINKKKYKIYREFPTGVFNRKISDSDRILSTEYIDILTLNNQAEYSLIELKVNDKSLGNISQLLDYALFIGCYYNQLKNSFEEYFEGRNKGDNINCYLAANGFHPRLQYISNYYSTIGKRYKINLKLIFIGKVEAI
jgi:hypothetical protein